MSAIDYKSLAKRLEMHAECHANVEPYDDEQRQWADDLRTVVSLLRGMAEAKPFAWAVRDGWGPTRFSIDPDTPIVGMRRADHVVDPLYLHPAPQPQPERQPVSEPTRWKVGNELAPYHPDASHVEPGYRDGWNACYRAMRESEPTEAQIEARDALLDFISENGTASEGVQHYLDRYVRAALAAKE